MPGSFFPVIRDRINDAIVNNTALDVAAVTVSAHTAEPDASGSSEASGGSYARQPLTCGTAASAKAISNTAAFAFDGMPAGTFPWLGIWDGSTIIGKMQLASPAVLTAGQSLTIAIGALDFVYTGALSTYAANKVLDAIFRSVSFVVAQAYTSVHSADPGDTGANEVGTRQAISFGASASGTAANDSPERFDGLVALPTHGGIWDASTSGNFLAANALSTLSYSVEIPVGEITLG